MRIDEELMEIWPNEVCDTFSTNTNPIYFLYDISGDLGDASVITLMFS